jgi:hypothetical protein
MTYVSTAVFQPGDRIVNRFSRKRMGRAAPKWRVEQVLPNGELNCWNPRRGWRTITHPENYLKFEPKALTLAAGAGGMEE